jgi:hypothetical protein
LSTHLKEIMENSFQSSSESFPIAVFAHGEKGKWLPPSVDVGVRFQNARGDRSVPEIEQLSGISDAIIRRCEKGQQAPNLELLAFYSAHDGISSDLILMGAAPELSLATLQIQALQLPPDQRVALAAFLLSHQAPGDAL